MAAKNKKKMKWTFVPNAVVSTSSGGSIAQQMLDRIASLNIPLKSLKAIANEFGTYVEVKLLPLKRKKRTAPNN